jgi:hypothetical protein
MRSSTFETGLNWNYCFKSSQVNLFYHNLETLQSKKNPKKQNTTTKTLKYINSGKVAQRETRRLIQFGLLIHEFDRSETLQRSLIYNKNKSGPRIEPWGTPHWILLDME